MQRGILIAPLLCAALMLGACSSGSGENLDVNGRPLDEGGAEQPLIATFGSIQAKVLTPTCTACHAGASAPLGLRLDALNAFALLVGVASAEVPSLLRVDPGNPDASYLLQKLEGTAAVGARMPLGAPALPQATIDVIRQWISDGAMPDPGQMDNSTPARVVTLSPLPGSTVSATPTQVLAAFSREIDAATINAVSFRIERSGGDGTFDDGNEVSISPTAVTLSLLNPTVATFELGPAPDVADTYRVTLAG